MPGCVAEGLSLCLLFPRQPFGSFRQVQLRLERHQLLLPELGMELTTRKLRMLAMRTSRDARQRGRGIQISMMTRMVGIAANGLGDNRGCDPSTKATPVLQETRKYTGHRGEGRSYILYLVWIFFCKRGPRHIPPQLCFRVRRNVSSRPVS